MNHLFFINTKKELLSKLKTFIEISTRSVLEKIKELQGLINTFQSIDYENYSPDKIIASVLEVIKENLGIQSMNSDLKAHTDSIIPNQIYHMTQSKLKSYILCTLYLDYKNISIPHNQQDLNSQCQVLIWDTKSQQLLHQGSLNDWKTMKKLREHELNPIYPLPTSP